MLSSIGQMLFRRYPRAIQMAMVEDASYAERIGLPKGHVFTIGGLRIDASTLYSGTRLVLSGATDVHIKALDEKKVGLRRADDSIELILDNGSTVRMPELQVLSPEPEERLNALRQIADRCGPTVSELLRNRDVSTATRALADSEVSDVLVELHHGVAARVARAAAALQSGNGTAEDVVPSDLAFHDQAYGPDPGTTDVDTYINEVLPSIREEWLRRDLVRGFQQCLFGAVHDRLCPTGWLESYNDDEVWSAIIASPFRSNPYSLLAVLDLALARARDGRFRACAEEAIALLVPDTLPNESGNDVYELMPCFAQLALLQLNSARNSASRPPYWKLMCAWSHAGVLAQCCAGFQLDIGVVQNWVDGQVSMVEVLAKLLDLRRAPMFSAGLTSKAALRAEVLRRVMRVYARHHGRSDVEAVLRPIEEKLVGDPPGDLPRTWLSAGPLEGSHRPTTAQRDCIPEGDNEELLQQLRNDPWGSVWSSLAQLTQICCLEETLLSAARESLKNAATPEDAAVGRSRLMDALLVAVSTADFALRDIVVERLLHSVGTVKTESDAVTVMNGIVLASALITDDTAWCEWLSKALADVMVRLQAEHRIMNVVLDVLDCLDWLVPLRAGVTAKARAIASAAL